VIGWPRHHYKVCDSTNSRARDLAAQGAPHGTVVSAEEQTAGRGRQGRAWTGPAGKALLCSVVLRPEPERAPLLPLTAAVAVCEAIEELGAGTCRIKWPNDVWIDRKKVAGILVEARPSEGWAVVGIGINVSISPQDFPAEIRDAATSLGPGVSVGAVLEALCARLDIWVAAEPASVIRSCRQRDALLGLGVSWAGGSGVAAGIDDGGGLLVDAEGGRVALSAGEVHLTVA
jgi:BirA family transcriptional regulator, biotin operon repressor / biotin---[acetyl-CoA-carboxylase] ligase